MFLSANALLDAYGVHIDRIVAESRLLQWRSVHCLETKQLSVVSLCYCKTCTTLVVLTDTICAPEPTNVDARTMFSSSEQCGGLIRQDLVSDVSDCRRNISYADLVSPIALVDCYSLSVAATPNKCDC